MKLPGGTVHDLKIWPEYYKPVVNGMKPFELRREEERKFAVGDLLVLREWNPKYQAFTRHYCKATVLYVLRDSPFLSEKVVCMGIKVNEVFTPDL